MNRVSQWILDRLGVMSQDDFDVFYDDMKGVLSTACKSIDGLAKALDRLQRLMEYQDFAWHQQNKLNIEYGKQIGTLRDKVGVSAKDMDEKGESIYG